jgi:hypothetical protein
MLRADLLDAMDYMMQTVRKNDAFGGVQVLFIGDLLQLPPVIRDEEWRTLRILQGNFIRMWCSKIRPYILNYQNFPSDRFHLYFCFEYVTIKSLLKTLRC